MKFRHVGTNDVQNGFSDKKAGQSKSNQPQSTSKDQLRVGLSLSDVTKISKTVKKMRKSNRIQDDISIDGALNGISEDNDRDMLDNNWQQKKEKSVILSRND